MKTVTVTRGDLRNSPTTSLLLLFLLESAIGLSRKGTHYWF